MTSQQASGSRRPAFRLSGPVLDAADPLGLAAFYQRLLGWPIAASEGPVAGGDLGGWAVLRSPDRHHKIEIQHEANYVAPTWPSTGSGQLMMLHLDFGVDDLDAGVRWAVEAGATVAGHQPQADVRVLLDPEGHPFCLFQERR